MPDQSGCFLAKSVAAAGGIAKWNEHSDLSQLSRMLDASCTATTVEEALSEIKGIMSLGHNLWAYAYLRTLFCVTMAWLLPQLQVSIADMTWAPFEGIAKVWLNGVVVAILFGYWAAALAFVAGVLTLVMSTVYTRWWVLLRFAPFPSRWKRALQTASNWDNFPGFWASLRGFGRAGIHTLRRVAGLHQHAWSLIA